MRWLVYSSFASFIVLGGCAVQGTEPHGIYATYTAHRVQTNLEPAPAFDWREDFTIDLSPADVTITTDEPRDGTIPVITGDHIEFSAGEAWTSPDGDSSPWIDYKLDRLYDGHLTGTAVAEAPLEAGGGEVFTFDFAITASPL